MDARLRRQALNEAFYREVNERIAALDRDAGWLEPEELVELHCECGRGDGCEGRLRMTLAEYDAVRRQDDRFAVLPGHETPGLERVVQRTDRFLVVDKVRAAEPLVHDDPRGAPSS